MEVIPLPPVYKEYTDLDLAKSLLYMPQNNWTHRNILARYLFFVGQVNSTHFGGV